MAQEGMRHMDCRGTVQKAKIGTEPNKESRKSKTDPRPYRCQKFEDTRHKASIETDRPDQQVPDSVVVAVAAVAFCTTALCIAIYLFGYWSPVAIALVSSVLFLTAIRGAAS